MAFGGLFRKKTANGRENASDKAAKAREALKKRLYKDFMTRYRGVRVLFSGTALQNKSVSLNKFYRDNGIAEGHLKGNWRLFEKADIEKYVDVGIAARAMERCNRAYTVCIEKYGRVVPVGKEDAYRNAVMRIKDDYTRYLNGEEVASVGDEPVKTPMALDRMIGESKAKLCDYLAEVFPWENQPQTSLFDGAASSFRDYVDELFDATTRALTHVDLQMIWTDYALTQWEDPAFVAALLQVCMTQPNAFDAAFVGRLEQYGRLLVEEDEK